MVKHTTVWCAVVAQPPPLHIEMAPMHVKRFSQSALLSPPPAGILTLEAFDAPLCRDRDRGKTKKLL